MLHRRRGPRPRSPQSRRPGGTVPGRRHAGGHRARCRRGGRETASWTAGRDLEVGRTRWAV